MYMQALLRRRRTRCGINDSTAVLSHLWVFSVLHVDDWVDATNDDRLASRVAIFMQVG